jgi:hypothetical protein
VGSMAMELSDINVKNMDLTIYNQGQIVLTNKSIKNDFKGSNVIEGIEVVF